nr:flagellar biosynthetic protein FliO [Oceanobacter mangrovi]
MFLVLVLGLILLLAWLAQRLRARGGMAAFQGGKQPIRVVASQALGMKERIAVVEVGGKQLVLGITAQQINLLTELDEPLATASEAPASFKELLKKAVKA